MTLYGRPGCHLCDEARTLLERLAPRMGFVVEEVNIEADDALLGRYMLDIPVIALGERELARAPVRPAALEVALREALAG